MRVACGYLPPRVVDFVVKRAMSFLGVSDRGLFFEGARWFQAPVIAKLWCTPDPDDPQQRG
eukprot:7426987-Lingulodinium_polyedra.AAC.1